jgi:hypothetical protein
MTVTANFVGDVTPAPPPASPPATLATLHVFMGNDFGSTVTGTDGLVCGGGVTLNCYQDYTVGQSVTVSDSNGGCEYFTDSLAGGTHSNPYTFTMTPETRTVAPHNSC